MSASGYAAPLVRILCFWAAAVIATPALAQTGTISGQVVNATAERPVAQQAVKLQELAGENPLTKTMTTDDQGRFEFTELPTNGEQPYALFVTYKDVDYATEAVNLNEDESSAVVNVVVFETTTDSSKLVVDSHHIIVDGDPEGGLLRVQEILIIRNASAHTLVPSGEEAVRFQLPMAATDVRVSARIPREDIQVQQNLIWVQTPVSPHGFDLAVQYLLAPDANPRQLARLTDYPTTRVNVFLAAVDWTIAGELLQPEQAVTMMGREYRRFSASDLPAESTIQLHFGSDQGDANGVARVGMSPEATRLGAMIVTLVAMVAFLMVPFIRKKAQASRTTQAALLAEKEDLLTEIAKLDIGHDRGDIPDDEYDALREKSKSRLRALMRDLQGPQGA